VQEKNLKKDENKACREVKKAVEFCLKLSDENRVGELGKIKSLKYTLIRNFH
jgi:hypothetical protein